MRQAVIAIFVNNKNQVLIGSPPRDDEFDQLLWIKAEDLPKYETNHRTSAYRKALQYCEML